MGAGAVSDFVACFGTLSSYWVALLILNKRGGAKPFCNSIIHDWLTSMGDLAFSEEKQERIGRRQGQNVWEESRERGETGWAGEK